VLLFALMDVNDIVIRLLEEQISQQASVIASLQEIIEKLEARVRELEGNQCRNSSNSSKPPSSDMGKVQRTKSLRGSSGKKPGGQAGHQGESLAFSAIPDSVIIHTASRCCCCDNSLADVAAGDYECRQVFDIPPIQMQVTEHRAEIKDCPLCGAISRGLFPAEVSQPVQYGTDVRQLAVYLTQYQLLPYGRVAEIFEDLLGHRVSGSFLVNNNRRCAAGLQPFIEELKTELKRQPVLHVDETGYEYNGRRNWLHTVSTDWYSFYMPHGSRGAAAMHEAGVLPGYQGIVVHDCWRAYNEFDCGHALCNVHHLRDLTFCHEIEKSNWAAKMKQFLLALHKIVSKVKQSGADSFTRGQWYYWSRKYDDLLNEGLRQHPRPQKQKGRRGVTKKSKTRNMLERFRDCKEEILAFASNFVVPFGNNIAEQAIRMMKVKQKISGCFRSEKGAKDFATIRSYIATIKKHGQNVMQALHQAILGNPLCPWA
jgi:transposase